LTRRGELAGSGKEAKVPSNEEEKKYILYEQLKVLRRYWHKV
jgi:hypothetical protein